MDLLFRKTLGKDAALSLAWKKKNDSKFEVIPARLLELTEMEAAVFSNRQRAVGTGRNGFLILSFPGNSKKKPSEKPLYFPVGGIRVSQLWKNFGASSPE